jgi:HK97 family phage prohead protease
MKSRAAVLPPTDVHQGDHSPGDLSFLFGMANNLRGSVAMAQAHTEQGLHPDVVGLAQQIVTTDGAQLNRLNSLQSRLGSATAYGSASSGHGKGALDGNELGGGESGNSEFIGGELRAASAPYGNVAYADPGYQKDGKKRYPIDTEAHVRAAWSYINQAGNAAAYSAEQLASIKSRITAAARKLGITISGRSEWDSPEESERSVDRFSEFERSVPFEMAQTSDGLTLEGYAAVFDKAARIRDQEGEFDEVIKPGAFRESLRERTPVLMFEHGKHPLIGSMPLGVLRHVEEDSRGLHIEARLSDNWLIQPVREAIRDGGVRGMSFRLVVPEGGDRWTRRSRDVELREVMRINTRELGPVVFPAYQLTTAHVRSALDCIDCNTGRSRTRSAGGGGFSDAQPGNGEASRIRAAIRILDVHPLLSKEHYRA